MDFCRLELIAASLAAIAAAIPIVAYPFARGRRWLDPYRDRGARWLVYVGALSALIFFLLAAGGDC